MSLKKKKKEIFEESRLPICFIKETNPAALLLVVTVVPATEIEGVRTWGLVPCDSQLSAKLVVSGAARGLRCAEEDVDEDIIAEQTLLQHLSGRYAGLQSEHCHCGCQFSMIKRKVFCLPQLYTELTDKLN